MHNVVKSIVFLLLLCIICALCACRSIEIREYNEYGQLVKHTVSSGYLPDWSENKTIPINISGVGL
jgi:hypothetical protein